MTYFSIDGIEWNVSCTIDRIAELTESEISGMMLNKTYFSDVIGTFMHYDIAVAVPFGMEDTYTQLYEALTAPVGYHTFVLPYNQSEITVIGRVQNVHDGFVRMPGDKHYWKGTKFSMLGNHPSKTLSLSEVLSFGMSPFPTSISLEVGSIWQYTATGWQEYIVPQYDNYDEMYF